MEVKSIESKKSQYQTPSLPEVHRIAYSFGPTTVMELELLGVCVSVGMLHLVYLDTFFGTLADAARRTTPK